MANYNIFRPLTNDEKKEIIPLGTTSFLSNFLKELAKKVSEYQKRYKPYDSYNARIDFDNAVEHKMKEMSVVIDKSDIVEFDFGDLDRYGEISRFEYLGNTEVQQTRLVAGIKQEVHIGKRYKFKSKQRGNKLSIFVPSDRLDEFNVWLHRTFDNAVEVEKEGEILGILDEEPKKEEVKKEEVKLTTKK